VILKAFKTLVYQGFWGFFLYSTMQDKALKSRLLGLELGLINIINGGVCTRIDKYKYKPNWSN